MSYFCELGTWVRVQLSGDAWDKQWPNEDARANGAPIGMLPKVRQTQWGWAIPSHVSPVLVAEAPFVRGQVGSFRQRPPDQLVHAAGSPNKT